MAEIKVNLFDIVLLIVGIAAAILGFQLINRVYSAESGQLSWLMITSIFSWLTLLVLFILLSVMVDVSKKELNQLKELTEAVSRRNKK